MDLNHMTVSDVETLDLDTLPTDVRDSVLTTCFRWAAERGGYLPEGPYFEKQLAFPTVFTELVTLVNGKYGWEVLLVEVDNKYYLGELSSTGKTRGMRDTMEEALDKVAQESAIPISGVESERPFFAGVVDMPSLGQGHPICLVWVRVLRENQKVGTFIGVFYPIYNLPSNVVPHHRAAMIPLAVKSANKRMYGHLTPQNYIQYVGNR